MQVETAGDEKEQECGPRAAIPVPPSPSAAGNVGRRHYATFADDNETEEEQIVSHCYEIPNPIAISSLWAGKIYAVLKHNVSQPKAAPLLRLTLNR